MNMKFGPINDPVAHLAVRRPDHPVLFFSARALTERYRAFVDGFPGLVTYAVKANPAREVLQALAAAGMRAFDVASPAEIDAVRAVCPGASLHYNNPIRSQQEIRQAVAAGARSFSVDRMAELEKLAAIVPVAETEVSVRLKLPMQGAAYDFGTKFGAHPAEAKALLTEAARLGFRASICFHPGTQCTKPAPWAAHIAAAAELAQSTGVRLARLNVGGGFPSHRGGDAPTLEPFFKTIERAVSKHFPSAVRPELVCEPGRAMVSDCMVLAVRVKARDGDTLFLNDGRYGGLSEFFDIGPVTRLYVPGRFGPARPFHVFGPTCDSLDTLPEPMHLPADIAEGDYVLIEGMGAYSNAIATGFNGYGAADLVTIAN